jgi:16S rRNA (guanine527-N7)-methyltransferase
MIFESRTSQILALGFREAALAPLRAYIDLLWTSNEELNLISRQMTMEELIDNHVIDSLLPLKMFPTDVKTIADFGSGGGLPAVIYAIQFPEIQFHLYEKSPKKQIFLNSCKVVAPNLSVHGEIPTELKGIDLITARGFKPIDVILEVSRNYYKKGGKYFLLKARREKIEEEVLNARKKFKDLQVKVEPLNSPVLQVERNLVLI